MIVLVVYASSHAQQTFVIGTLPLADTAMGAAPVAELRAVFGLDPLRRTLLTCPVYLIVR